MSRRMILGLCVFLVCAGVVVLAVGLGRRALKVVARVRSTETEVVAWLRFRREADRMVEGRQRPAKAYEAFKQTHVELIRQPLVINAALRIPGIAQLPIVREQKDPAKWLADALSVTTSPQTEMIRVRLRGPDSEQLIQLLNAVLKAYQGYIVGVTRTECSQRLLALRPELERRQQEIQRKELALAEKTKQLGTSMPEGGALRQELQMRELDRLERRVDRLEDRLLDLDSQLRVQAELGRAPDVARDQVAARSLRELQLRREVVARAWEDSRQKYAAQRAQLLKAERARVEVIALTREINRLKDLMAQVERRIKQLGVEQQSPPRVVVLQQAAIQ